MFLVSVLMLLTTTVFFSTASLLTTITLGRNGWVNRVVSTKTNRGSAMLTPCGGNGAQPT